MASMVSRPFSPSLSTTPLVLPEPMISRERVAHGQVAVYAGQILGFAVGRLEPHVADFDESRLRMRSVPTNEATNSEFG